VYFDPCFGGETGFIQPSSLSSPSSTSSSTSSFASTISPITPTSNKNQTLPSIDYLASRILVVLSTDRLSHEFKQILRERYEFDDYDEGSMNDGDDSSYNSNNHTSSSSSSRRPHNSAQDQDAHVSSQYPTSTLLKIHWRRVIQDEGHSRGSSALTNIGIVMNDLSADSRLIMTGTPLLRDQKEW
jgi:hypothetical protein